MDFLSVWQQHKNGLQSILRRQLPDANQVDDIMQVIFIKASQHWSQLHQPEKAKAWLSQIARNALIDFFRKDKKQQKIKDQLSAQVDAEPDENWNEFQERLAYYIPEAIQLLPEKYREAVYLTEIEGLSQKELAQRLGISYSGAKSRVQRGKQKLKEIILECCLVKTDSYGNVLDYRPRAPKNEPCSADCAPKGKNF